MAVSISQAQAEALAAGLLDDMGTARDAPGIRPDKTVSALIILAGGLVQDAQENLNKAARVATGALSESLKVMNPEMAGSVITVDVQAADYYKFIDAGVKGAKGGNTSAKGYSFKKKMPPVNVIRKWVIREGLKGKRDQKYKNLKLDTLAASKRDTRRKSITETSNAVAFRIARAIRDKGLKRTNFFSKALASTRAKSKDVFGKAFKLDVINSLPKKI